MRSTFLYALKVWIAGFVLSPFILILSIILSDIKGSDIPGSLELMLLFVMYGCVLSVPSFVLLWYSSKILVVAKWNTIKIKALLTVIGVLLTILPFYLGSPFGMSLEEDMISIPFYYGSVIVASIWYFKLPLHTEANNELPSSPLS